MDKNDVIHGYKHLTHAQKERFDEHLKYAELHEVEATYEEIRELGSERERADWPEDPFHEWVMHIELGLDGPGVEPH